MSVSAAFSRPIYRSPRELLAGVLHDLAQPISALECATEVALQKPRSPETYVAALVQMQEISGRMRNRLEYFRALARAVEAADCMRPVNTETVLAAVVEEVSPLAEALGTRIEVSCESLEVFGNEEKMKVGMVWLLDYLLARRTRVTLQLTVDHRCGGELRLFSSRDGESCDDSLFLAQTAFATMGVEVRMEPCEGELMAKVQLSPYRQPAAQTSVLVGDF